MSRIITIEDGIKVTVYSPSEEAEMFKKIKQDADAANKQTIEDAKVAQIKFEAEAKESLRNVMEPEEQELLVKKSENKEPVQATVTQENIPVRILNQDPLLRNKKE